MACRHSQRKFTLLEGKKVEFNSNGICYYYINNYSPLISFQKQRKEIDDAFEKWNSVLYLYNKKFIYTDIKESAYMQIYFIGHQTKFYPTEPHLKDTLINDPDLVAYSVEDCGKIYIVDAIKFDDDVIDLATSIAHEIGHALTIGHATKEDDIMYFRYIHGNVITSDSINAINSLYGNKSIYVGKIIDIAIVFVLISIIIYLNLKQ